MQQVVVKMGFGKKNDHVRTPKELFELLDKEFDFDFDPCPWQADFDSLPEDFEWGLKNFVNPPYSNVAGFAEKAIKESKKGKMSVLLIPARLNTKYWKDWVWPYASEIRIKVGGIQFEGYGQPSPFIVALVIIPANAEAKCRLTQTSTYKWHVVVPRYNHNLNFSPTHALLRHCLLINNPYHLKGHSDVWKRR